MSTGKVQVLGIYRKISTLSCSNYFSHFRFLKRLHFLVCLCLLPYRYYNTPFHKTEANRKKCAEVCSIGVTAAENYRLLEREAFLQTHPIKKRLWPRAE